MALWFFFSSLFKHSHSVVKIAAAAVHVGGINELAYFYRPRDQVANYNML